MSERYSEKARSVIFRARAIALDAGCSEICPPDLLAAIAETSPELFKKADLRRVHSLSRHGSPRESRGAADTFDRPKEAPLDQDSKRALQLADELALELGAPAIGPIHMLWGILHVDSDLARALNEAGLDERDIRALSSNYEDDGREVQAFEQTPSLAYRAPRSRSGIGYDLHRLAEGRKLLIGGIELPYEKGSVGHSDGDVLSHALCDALLGAAGLGDIGTHFPDTDPSWKGASSQLFLEYTRKLLDERGLRITHVDAIVVCERPKLGPHFPAMRGTLAKSLGITLEQINLKAKTNEGTGDIGRGEAIAAYAIATVEL
jgi:2-C-methyl-D-erythritol 2,4-cyclodiphosphate synthase